MDTLRKQEIIVYALLWALFLLMPPMRFLRIHKSYIVNTSYIESATRTSVRMKGGTTLTVGESYRAAFCEALDI